MINLEEMPYVEEGLPEALQVHVPCACHHHNGQHFRCLIQRGIDGVQLLESAARNWTSRPRRWVQPLLTECYVAQDLGAVAIG